MNVVPRCFAVSLVAIVLSGATALGQTVKLPGQRVDDGQQVCSWLICTAVMDVPPPQTSDTGPVMGDVLANPSTGATDTGTLGGIAEADATASASCNTYPNMTNEYPGVETTISTKASVVGLEGGDASSSAGAAAPAGDGSGNGRFFTFVVTEAPGYPQLLKGTLNENLVFTAANSLTGFGNIAGGAWAKCGGSALTVTYNGQNRMYNVMGPLDGVGFVFQTLPTLNNRYQETAQASVGDQIPVGAWAGSPVSPAWRPTAGELVGGTASHGSLDMSASVWFDVDTGVQ